MHQDAQSGGANRNAIPAVGIVMYKEAQYYTPARMVANTY